VEADRRGIGGWEVKNLDRSKLSVGARWRSLKEIVTAVWRHPANRSRRTQTLWRILGFHFVDRMRAPLGDHSEIWVDRRFSASLKVLIGNPPDWAEMQVWKKRLGPGDLFVDVGTNVGIYSIWAADWRKMPGSMGTPSRSFPRHCRKRQEQCGSHRTGWEQ
jgi:hypothetical protein